jgi:hypothetical protein
MTLVSFGLIAGQCARTCAPYTGHRTLSTSTQRRNTSDSGVICPTASRLEMALPAQKMPHRPSSRLGNS